MLVACRSFSGTIRVTGAFGLVLLSVNLIVVTYLSTVPKWGNSVHWHATLCEMRRFVKDTGNPITIDGVTPPVIFSQLREAGIPFVVGAVTFDKTNLRHPINGIKDCYWQASQNSSVPSVE